ncbi:hypothetical protein K491DRAFT_713274 [Lophiostoma macrostomum CBS 122681]|uniref:Uncharacterized protein n=1 Tax=Lophiostoma macrostomum CBS 122681 TaxID=1314788 RepID=A0A6A6TIQ2_9PLEO|nr:hypothetical protein K491DRAFT_713274 [Lophiostoma macrostomum CBS 122681]
MSPRGSSTRFRRNVDFRAPGACAAAVGFEDLHAAAQEAANGGLAHGEAAAEEASFGGANGGRKALGLWPAMWEMGCIGEDADSESSDWRQVARLEHHRTVLALFLCSQGTVLERATAEVTKAQAAASQRSDQTRQWPFNASCARCESKEDAVQGT